MKTLSLGYSPCPNDTFIFYALVHNKIDTGDLEFREILEDVETLNQMARRSALDITKVSFHAFAHLKEQYCLLHAGGALGRGCGPLVVARESLRKEDLRGKIIAIPGMLTTAFLLLRILDDSLKNHVKVMPFHRIIDAVRDGEADAGLIIHESRFTYREAGLKEVIDLGEWWEQETGCPIPLGGIIAQRGLGYDLIQRINALIRKSLAYATAHREEPLPYIRKYSQEINDKVMMQHIGLYVNEYSLDIGEAGILAVEEVFRRAEACGIIPASNLSLFAAI